MLTFRLDTEPWIPVVGLDGAASTVNLIDAFRAGSRLSRLAGTPLEAAAITRFLLAIAHLTETPVTLAEWAGLWNEREEFMARCAAYVRAQGDAWDLFHATHPFGQVPGMPKTDNPAHILAYEAARKNNPVFADHSLEEVPAAYSPAALVRGMIVTNAYAGSSGGGYRSGALAMRSVAMLEGRSVTETLLLNLLVQKQRPAPFDWATYGHGPLGPVPSDLARRYLWTSRRIRIASNARIMLAPGNEMDEAGRAEDPMIAMRKDSKGTAYVPLRLDAGRALWRSANVLLNWHDDTRRLHTVDQLHRLVARRLFPTAHAVSLRVCAVAGDAQGPSTELWRDEVLAFGLSVIADDNRFASLLKAVDAAEGAATSTRKRIYAFSARYLTNGAAAADPANVGKLSDELSPDLADFWEAVAPAGERIACDEFDEASWTRLLAGSSEQTFRYAVERLPPNARRLRAEFERTVKNNRKKGATK